MYRRCNGTAIDDFSRVFRPFSLLRGIGQPFDYILATGNAHDGHAGHLAYTPLQVPVVRSNNVDFVSHNAVHNAVIGIDAFVVALQSLPSFVSRYSQRKAIFRTEFLQLSHNAGCDHGTAFGIETRHHRVEKVELLLDSMREEIGIDEDGIRRSQGGVVLEEERGRNLRDFTDDLRLGLCGFLLFLLLQNLVLLEARISLADYTLDLVEEE